MHMGTHTLTVHQQGPACRTTAALTLRMADGKPFAFSALPYTPHQLESAAHADELPAPAHTILTVMGPVRGVGGIDSWGHRCGTRLPCQRPAGSRRQLPHRAVSAKGRTCPA